MALKKINKLVLTHAILYLNRRPKLRHAALRVLTWFPGLKARLVGAAMGRYDTPTSSTIPTYLQHLTPRARQIHDDLKTAMKRRQKAPD